MATLDPVRNAATLIRCGRALHGQNWRSDVARMLGVDNKTVGRWENGTTTYIDDAHWKILRAALRDREIECAALAALIGTVVPE